MDDAEGRLWGSRMSPEPPTSREHAGAPSSPRRGLTDESEILRFLQHGTLVGLLPVPHPILIRKYQANSGTAMWFRTYMWGVIYLRWALWETGSYCLHWGLPEGLPSKARESFYL
jgi:hypothetical protein